MVSFFFLFLVRTLCIFVYVCVSTLFISYFLVNLHSFIHLFTLSYPFFLSAFLPLLSFTPCSPILFHISLLPFNLSSYLSLISFLLFAFLLASLSQCRVSCSHSDNAIRQRKQLTFPLAPASSSLLFFMCLVFFRL